jgi:hypothetical protein
MERDRGPTAALVITLLLGLLSRCSSGSAIGGQGPPGCATRWIEVEGTDGITSAVACAMSESDASAPEGPARLLVGMPIELNRASPSTLEVLPGIGPERAGAIVRERCREPFERLADVDRVRGIGPKIVAGLRDQAVVGPPTPECATTPTLPP